MGRINQRTNKKKHIALILVLIICLMFSACGDATVIEPDLTVETTGNSLSLDEGESLQKESEIITSEEETEEAESNETEEDTEEEGSSEVEAESDATDNTTADVSSECGHVWSEWRALEKATCERNGSQLRECTSCGEREEQVVLASGHAMKNGVCSVCGYEEQKECKHDKTDWVVTKEATCTETGSRNQVCLYCEAVLSTKTLPALGHTIKDTAAKAATCTENGWEAYQSCTFCGYSTKKEIKATGHQYQEGTCKVCGSKDPFYVPPLEKITVPALEKKEHSIAGITKSETSIPAAEMIVYNGNITEKGQVDTYTYTVPRDGRVRIDVTEVYSGVTFILKVIDNLGNVVDYNNYCVNERGITLSELKKGESYQIQVAQKSGYSSYKLTIGQQKETIDISGYTEIRDSVEYVDQSNVYTFEVAVDGLYLFQIMGMTSDTSVYLKVYNYLGETIGYNNYGTNGKSITVSDLKAGQTYQFEVIQKSGFSSYTLAIGIQKPIVNVTAYTDISDSIEYKEQKNIYVFTVPVDGQYCFEISGMTSDASVYLKAYNHLGEIIGYNNYGTNGKTVILTNLEVGQTYQFEVAQKSGFSRYTLSIRKQKTVVDVSSKVEISDSIEYEDQKNIYNFVADESGNHNLTVSGMVSGTTVELYVLNHLGETVAYDNYCVNGDSILLKDLAVGTQYEIQIRQKTGTSTYVLTIK